MSVAASQQTQPPLMRATTTQPRKKQHTPRSGHATAQKRRHSKTNRNAACYIHAGVAAVHDVLYTPQDIQSCTRTHTSVVVGVVVVAC